MLLLVELDTTRAERKCMFKNAAPPQKKNKIRDFATNLLTRRAKSSECRAQADAKRAAGAAETQGGTWGRGCRGVREEGAALGCVGD